MKTVIILGTSRSEGNTAKIVEIFRSTFEADLIDIAKLNISYYDYDHRNRDDDFLPTIGKILEYDLVVFATPVYWYSMSAVMKTFFDRISDLLTIEKEIGRKLRGKKMAAIACGQEETETEGFFVPFRETAGYLGMQYLGHLHAWIEDSAPSPEVIDRVNEFSRKLQNEQSSN